MSEEEANRKHEEFRLLYSASVSDIENFKQQQWRLANYALLLYAVIYWIANQVGDLTLFLAVIFYILVFLIAVAGLTTEEILEKSIKGRRKRIARIRVYFSTEFNDAWEVNESRNSLLWMFQALFMAGFIIDNLLFYMIYLK